LAGEIPADGNIKGRLHTTSMGRCQFFIR